MSIDHSIVICVHNALSDLSRCIESLTESVGSDCQIVLVDDASDVDTEKYIRGLKESTHIETIRLDTRVGYTKAANVGLRHTSGQVVTLLNSDTIVPPGWSKKTLQAFMQYPEFGILGPLSNAASYQSVPSIEGSGGQTAINRLPDNVSLLEVDTLCENAGANKIIPHVPLVHGFCFSITRRCLIDVGEFDEVAFPMGYGEENDFCVRAVDAGFALGILITTYVYHAKSKSYASEERNSLMKSGWEALVSKHGRRRLVRAVKVMESQPTLVYMRQAVQAHFERDHNEQIEGSYVRNERSGQTKSTNKSPDIKVIAFYLPQYHPVPFNDIAWGEGFTEWKNVVRAKPRFPAHIQPKLPGKLGFYDLRRTAVMQDQANIAEDFDVYGVCMYYYRLEGKRILETPPETLLIDLSIRLRFCYCWANESWTRAWDGVSSEILLKQDYDEATFWGLVHDIVRASRDDRYIKINDRPIFIVYQAAEIPDGEAWIHRLRMEIDRLSGQKFLIGTVYSTRFEASMLNYIDFVVQFPPHRIGRRGKRVTIPAAKIQPFEPERGDYFEAYEDVVNASLAAADMYDPQFLTVCPDWDNTARRQTNAHTLIGSTPAKFREWVEKASCLTRQKFDNGKIPAQVLFVNAWNEWAEGAMLEPSEQHGWSYLQALKAGLR